MRPRAPLSFFSAVAAASMVVALGALMAACAKQGEAERCSTSNGNDDCSGDLQCVTRPGVNSTICCPPPDQASTNECKGVLVPTTDAAGDTPKEVAVVDAAVPPEGGLNSACVFESDCAAPLRCRLGKCNFECKGDRDCLELESKDRPFCDSCGDHQCHATSKPEFQGTKDPDSGVCVPPDAGAETGTDSATDDTADTATVEDTADATLTDSTAADGD